MKMMGKRVNYAARSVISPDPNLDTNEVGVPLFMAKRLTFPENVNETNYKLLSQLVSIFFLINLRLLMEVTNIQELISLKKMELKYH